MSLSLEPRIYQIWVRRVTVTPTLGASTDMAATYTREHQMRNCGYLTTSSFIMWRQDSAELHKSEAGMDTREAIELRGTGFPFYGRWIVSSYNTSLNIMKQSTGTFGQFHNWAHVAKH